MRSVWETQIEPYIDRIADWAEQGATNKEIADKLHIHPYTLRKYENLGRQGEERYTSLVSALERARAVADDAVEAALFRSCQGYTVKVLKQFRLKLPGGGETLQSGEEEVHIPASPDAQKFWLTNRRKLEWKYKPDEADTVGGTTVAGVVVMPAVQAAGQAAPIPAGADGQTDGQTDGQIADRLELAAAGQIAGKNA